MFTKDLYFYPDFCFLLIKCYFVITPTCSRIFTFWNHQVGRFWSCEYFMPGRVNLHFFFQYDFDGLYGPILKLFLFRIIIYTINVNYTCHERFNPIVDSTFDANVIIVRTNQTHLGTYIINCTMYCCTTWYIRAKPFLSETKTATRLWQSRSLI